MSRSQLSSDASIGSPSEGRLGYPRVDLIVFGIAVLGAIALVGADFYMRHVSKSIAELTDIDGQKNFTTWFHSSLLLGAALSALLVIPTVSGARSRSPWAVLAGGLTFFSLDKSISLHEQVGRGLVHTFSLSDSASRVAWEAAWSPIILATAVALILCVWKANRTTQLWAFGMLLGGGIKLGMEAVMFPAIHYLGASEHGVFYGFEVELEESIQLVAFACLFAGLAQFFLDQVFDMATRREESVGSIEDQSPRPPIAFRRTR